MRIWIIHILKWSIWTQPWLKTFQSVELWKYGYMSPFRVREGKVENIQLTKLSSSVLTCQGHQHYLLYNFKKHVLWILRILGCWDFGVSDFWHVQILSVRILAVKIITQTLILPSQLKRKYNKYTSVLILYSVILLGYMCFDAV